jgi:hypothetical protein
LSFPRPFLPSSKKIQYFSVPFSFFGFGTSWDSWMEFFVGFVTFLSPFGHPFKFYYYYYLEKEPASQIYHFFS